ncbi:MAG: prepilin-type N-terminal cleavage/methylation domain-containing protein [Gemmatimonadaceae bacterium]|nr:prepilin-type N-terminal cleavage/methylation domain-containing protein [Gloeobacterales cyanobacterium ES-bin-141]
MKTKRSARGFTLLELAVTVAVATILGTGVTIGLVSFSQHNARENSITTLQTNLRRALQFAARDLKEAQYVYSTAELTGRVPVLTNDDGTPLNATPILAFWWRNPTWTAASPISPYEQIVYYLTSPPKSSSFRGPRLVSRLQLTFTTAANPDSDNNQYLNPVPEAAKGQVYGETLAQVPTGCNVSVTPVLCGSSAFGVAPATFSVLRTQALIDHLDPSGGMSATKVGNQNQTVLLGITGSVTELPGMQTSSGKTLLSEQELGLLRQQLIATARNR